MHTLFFTDSRPADATAPAVILLHGMLLDSRVWAPTLPFLTDYRVIAIDLPGHGQSRDVAAHTLADWVSAVGTTIDAAGINPAVLVGSSAGAIVALELAVRRPDLVAGAVLMGCFGHATVTDAGFRAAMTGFAGQLGDAAASGDLSAVGEAAVPGWLGPHAGSLAPGWLLQMVRRADPQVVSAVADDLLGWDPRSDLPGVTVPLTWSLGAHEDIPQEVVRADAAMSPAGRFLEISGAGHLPQVEVPALAAALIAEQVARAAAPQTGTRPQARSL